jgi:hypothetical protein
LARPGRSSWCCCRQSSHTPEVLGDGREEELVPGARQPWEAHSLEAHSGFEMRKQHLDLLPFVPGSLELRRTGKLTGVITGLFVDAAEHDPFRVRYPLVGTRAAEITGFDISGRYLDELRSAESDQP